MRYDLRKGERRHILKNSRPIFVTPGRPACIGFEADQRRTKTKHKLKQHKEETAMKKTFIATVLSLSLVAGFEVAKASDGQHEGAISATQQDDSAEVLESASGPTELIGRGGRGGGM